MPIELDYVLERLRQQKHPLREIADATGLHKNTIRCIASGKTPNPGIKTVEALAQYFKALEM